MPRYFFNVEDGRSFPDQSGTELSSIEAARRQALRYAGELLRDAPETFWSGEDWRMIVTDNRGLALFYLVFAGIDAPALR